MFVIARHRRFPARGARGNAQHAIALVAEFVGAPLDGITNPGKLDGFSGAGFGTAGDRQHLGQGALGDYQVLVAVRDQDAQPLAHEVVGNLVQLLVSGRVEPGQGADCLVNRVGEPGRECGVEPASNRTRGLGLPSQSSAACSSTLPSVRVPVLSVHSTSMLPKFSMAARRLTMTFCSAMRRAPCARLTLMMAGRSWG